MSRKPLSSATGPRSNASVTTMPAPSRTMARPGKPTTIVRESVKVAATESRPTSPNGGSRNRRTVSAEKKVASKASTVVERTVDGEEMNIQVVVRCRGRSPMEVAQRSPIICQTTGSVSSAITIETSHTAMSNISGQGLAVTTLPYTERAPVSKTYGFDRVFGPEADQTIVYKEVVENMLDEVVAGYNCTIFAYGQTGTGKTYTMQGDIGLTPLGKPCAEAGIIPRALHRLFSLLESVPNADFSVKCSYMELYNEELRDLLASDFHQPVALGGPGSNAQGQAVGGLKIYDDANKKGGVTIQGLEETNIRDAKEGLNLLSKGSQRRQVAETKMNTESSRSHSIFSLTVHIKESAIHGGEDLLKVGKLNLVDLAGSEAIGRSGAENKRAREAGMINQSLLTLGRVISALVEKNSHVPYRESKLTRLLQDSLGGRTKTCIVATVSPTKSNMEETLSTLDYAIRAKTIRNKPEVNQRLTKGTLIKDYINEIERLKSDLNASHEKNGIYFSAETWAEMTLEHEETKNHLSDIRQRADALDNKHATLTAEFEQNMNMLLAREEELSIARRQGEAFKLEVERVQKALLELGEKVDQERWIAQEYQRGEEHIDGVAHSLKTTVVDSLKDVGGLFDKLSRKSSVLDSNTGSTTAYSHKLTHLAGQLHHDIGVLKTVQSGFGGTLQQELEAFALRGAETLEQDKAFLGQRLESMVAQMETLKSRSEQDASLSSQSLDQLRLAYQGIHQDVLGWMSRYETEQKTMHDELVAEHATYRQNMQDCLTHTADLVDSVANEAVKFARREMDSHEKRREMLNEVHEKEITKLRAQNTLLASLLEEERRISAQLKTDMIAQLTALLTNHSLAQTQRLETVLGGAQDANQKSIDELTKVTTFYDEDVRFAASEADKYCEGIELAKANNETGRQSSSQILSDADAKLAQTLDANLEASQSYHGEQTAAMIRAEQVMTEGITQVGQGISSSQQHVREDLGDLRVRVTDGLEAASDRIVTAKEDIKVVSRAVLDAHAASEPIFAQHCTQAQSQLADLRREHEAYMANLKHDMPTGTTPKKKTWDVPGEWRRTLPRDALLKQYASSTAGGGATTTTTTRGPSKLQEQVTRSESPVAMDSMDDDACL